MENRNGLIVGAVATRASCHAERLAALHLLAPHVDRPRPIRFDNGDETTFTARRA